MATLKQLVWIYLGLLEKGMARVFFGGLWNATEEACSNPTTGVLKCDLLYSGTVEIVLIFPQLAPLRPAVQCR